MNAFMLARILGQLGVMYHRDNFPRVIDYFSLMLEDKRVIVIEDDDKPCAVLFISMTDDAAPYLVKKPWAYIKQDVDGSICYVEKMISNGWNKEMRKKIESAII